MEQGQSLEDFLERVAKQTWQIFRRDALTFVLASALVSFLSLISLGVLAGPLAVGFLELVRRGERGEPLQVGDVFVGLQRFAASFVLLLLIAMAAGLGMLLFVLPGLLVLLFTVFALPALAYEQLTAVDAIRRSVSVVRKELVPTLVLLALLSVLQSLGGSTVVGVLLTTPLSLIALAVAYQRLSASVPGAGPAVPPGVVVR